MNIHLKKLPSQWRYLVSRRQIRTAITARADDVRLIQFSGTAHKPSKITAGLYTAGRLDARPHEGRWCFRFCFYGLPVSVIDLASAAPSTAILNEIDHFLMTHADAPDSTVAPENCILFFRLAEGLLTPSFSTKKVDTLSESVAQNSPWW